MGTERPPEAGKHNLCWVALKRREAYGRFWFGQPVWPDNIGVGGVKRPLRVGLAVEGQAAGDDIDDPQARKVFANQLRSLRRPRKRLRANGDDISCSRDALTVDQVEGNDRSAHKHCLHWSLAAKAVLCAALQGHDLRGVVEV
jgi:hypothetical protein